MQNIHRLSGCLRRAYTGSGRGDWPSRWGTFSPSVCRPAGDEREEDGIDMRREPLPSHRRGQAGRHD